MISLELRGIVVNKCPAFQLDLQIEISLIAVNFYFNINVFYINIKVTYDLDARSGNTIGVTPCTYLH